MAQFDPRAYLSQFDSAWNNWNPANAQAGLPPELLAAINRMSADGRGESLRAPGNAFQLTRIMEDTAGGYDQGSGDNAMYVPTKRARYMMYTPSAQNGDQIPVFDESGKFLNFQTVNGSGQDLTNFLIPLAAAGGMAFGLGGAAGAGASGGSTAAGGSGAFLGEGALSGVGAWDGALAGAGAGGTATMGAGGTVLMDVLKTGASKVMGGGGGIGGTGFSWGDVIGAGTQLIGGAMQAKAAGDASDDLVQATREAAALQEPWRQKGISSLNRMALLLGLEGDAANPDYGKLSKPFTFNQDDPSYKWRFDEGMRGVKNAYAGKGKFLSGGALRGLTEYGQGMASTEYGKAFDRDMATKTADFNRLASVAGTGQTASNTMGEYRTQGGNASAAGTVGTANAIGNTLTGLYNNWNQNELMSQLLRR